MKTLLFIIPGLFFCFVVVGQPVSYDAASIPAQLKDGAHVVKRYEEIIFRVKDVDAASYFVRRVYTILDEAGKDKLNFHEFTNRFLTIDEVDIRLYDAAGKQKEKYKKKDLGRQARLDGLVADGMHHFLSLTTTSYPVTVEYIYEIKYSGTLFYPTFYIQDSEESVEAASFTATVPADLDLRYREQRMKVVPVVTAEGKNKTYKWTVKNLPAYEEEEGTVESLFYGNSIMLAPNKFSMFNTYGEMTSWKGLGKWAHDLTKGLDELPTERIAFFQSLVKNAASDREKVAIIYKYLQQNFRYVSIQLGIGGYKPFPAKFTDEKKYGDCKGLSFYMHSVLKAIGIRSHCALIYSGYYGGRVPNEFPSQNFNHVILCVPQNKDSIWLECTSNTAEFAVLGSWTENRNALLLTEDGGVLVPTPSSKASNNFISSNTTVKLNEDGSGTTVTNISSRGIYKEIISKMVSAKKDDQKEMIVYELGYKQPDEFTVNSKQGESICDVNLGLSIEKIPQFSAGNKMFLNPRVYNIWRKAMPKSEKRKYDFYFKAPFIKSDTTVYVLPSDYASETVPPPVTLSCEYGSYSTSYSFVKERNELISVARLELKHNIIPAEKYSEVKKFFDSVISDDGQKLVIRKN